MAPESLSLPFNGYLPFNGKRNAAVRGPEPPNRVGIRTPVQIAAMDCGFLESRPGCSDRMA